MRRAAALCQPGSRGAFYTKVNFLGYRTRTPLSKMFALFTLQPLALGLFTGLLTLYPSALHPSALPCSPPPLPAEPPTPTSSHSGRGQGSSVFVWSPL